MATEARIKLAVEGASAAVTHISSVTNSLGGLENKAKDFQGLWSGLIGGLTVGALTTQVKSIVDAADSMNDLSQRIGITISDLGKYQLATAQSGTTMEAMAKGIKALAGNLAEHGDELRAAGITATTADGAFQQLADKFAAMPDGIEKTALATKIFGKAGVELIPTLNLGSAGLQESAEKSARYAATLELLAPQADKFNDQMAELGLHTKVAGMAIVNDAMPAMISIAQAMSLAAQESGLLMAAWVGLGGAMDEFIAKPFKVIFLGINNTIDEANARLMLFFRQTGEADKLYAAVARRNKEILALTSQTAAPAAAAAKTFDTAKWTADYKALMAAIGGVKDGASAASKAAREAAAELEKQARAEQKHWEDLGKTITANEAAHAKWLDQNDKTIDGLIAGNQTLREQNEAIGLSKEALDALTLARQDAAIAQAELNLIDAQNIEGNEARIEQIQREIRLLKERRELTAAGQTATAAAEAQKTAREVAEKTAKDAAAEWQKASDQIQQSLSDALMDAFMAGKGFGKTFVDSIKSMFNSMVLRPVISAIVSPVAGAITSALGFSGAANAASTGGSLLSGGADLLGMGSALAGAGSFMGQLGTGLLASTQTALGLTATAAQASYAASMGVAAQTGSLIGSLGPLISAAPYLVALAGVYMLAKKLDKSGTPHSGGGAMYSAGGGLQTQGLANGWSGGGAYLTDFGGFKVTEDATKMAAGIAQSVVGLLDSAAVTFGQKAGYTAATAFADDSSTDGAWGALAIKLGDTMVTEWAQWANGPGGTTFSDGSAGSAEYLAKISSDVRTVLNGIDMPQWAKKVLNDLPDGATLQQMGEAVAAITKTQTAWERLGKTLAGFGAMSDEAKVKLTSASGGIDALVTNASAYYDNFYTEGERTAATLGSIKDAFDAVAVPMPATREAFRTLVESLEATADTNPYASAALATVLSLSGAFASVVPAAAAAENATTTLVDTVEEVATLDDELKALRNPVRSIKDVAQGLFNLQKEGANLQVELWRTYGDSNSIMAANKLQRDIETAGMTAQEIAQYDLNAARRAEIDTIVQQRQAHADAVASWQTYFDLFATPQEKQTRARAIVQAVLPADVDTLQEYKDYVWGLTVQFGLGSAEMKAATDVAQQFALAFPEVAQEIAEVSAASTVLTKDLSAFRAGFFTTAEQTALATQDMTASLQALGLTTLPTSNAEFRALALGIDTSTESGKLLFNGLMGLAGGFAQLHPLVTTATEVVETLDSAIASLRASGASRTVQQIAGNMLTLEEQIFQLQNAGNTAALRGHILDGLSDVKDSVTGLSERDLQVFVWSLQDSAQAALDLAAANKIAEDEAARAADAIASEMQRAADAAAAAAQRVASEHDSLWRQWLTANGDTAALRALDLAALDPSNRALQEQIWALEDQKKAADEATSAAEQMKSAWGSLTDSMIDEVRRIRGLMDESSGAGYASLASQFAVATAQSRAGDQAAAKLLPGLSQSMLTAYEASATSLVDLQRVRALTANSLEQTAGLLGASPQTLAAALPNGTATATGTALNSYAPAAVTAPGPSLTDVVTELRAEIAALKDELKGMRGEAKATSETIAINTGKTARLNQKWDDVGLPITTETDLVAVYGA